MIRKVDVSSVEEFMRGKRTYNRVSRDIIEFHESGWPVAEVDVSQYTNASSCAASYYQAARRMNVPVTAIIRDGKAYLISKEVIE